MKRVLLASFVIARIASAEPHHVLVLRAEGSADAGVRSKVDGQILKLAKSIEGNVEAGEISFSDASAMVGCTGTEAQCRDDVLSTLGVDEVVATTVTTSPSGETKIVVRRIGKGAPAREGTSTIPAGQPIDGKLSTDVGPMFGVIAPPHVDKPPPVVVPPPTPEVSPTLPPTPTPTPAAPTVTAAPNNQLPPQVDQAPHDHRTLELAGLYTSGGLLLLSFIMWGEASSIQGQINSAPTMTPTDFKNLQNLENSGDSYAGFGNLCFIGGVAIGAVAGYFFWRDHQAGSTKQARVTPAVFDHGGGLTLTIGGAP